MRKKKNGEARLSACAELLLGDINEPMKDPASKLSMPGAEVFLEIGAGKGGFATEMAKRHENAAYFAMEKVSDCVVLAAEKAKSIKPNPPQNLRFIVDTADNLTKLFELGTVDRIFLNFSDPWSKKGYAKRRLTHRRYLAVYLNILKDGGKITFKTDNDDLFDFSLSEIEAMGIAPDFVTRDLHNSERDAENIRTEYECNFAALGKNINMVEFTKSVGYSVEIPENLSKNRKNYFFGE